MSYAQYSTTDRWRWVDGCVHEHVSNLIHEDLHYADSHFQWDQNESIPKAKCYKLNATMV